MVVWVVSFPKEGYKKGNVFGKNCILWTDLVGRQILGIISGNKSSQKLKLSRNIFYKNCAPKLQFN